MREFQPNETVNNRYKVLRKLGAGAMGSVYLCQDSVENGIKVALKVLVSDDLEDQDVWAKGEYEALTRLRHPNLARVYNFGKIEETQDYFIVSEFIKGVDLFSATEYLKYDEIIDIVVQVCRALEYIHSQGYVHFDVKPDNILVSRQKTVGIRDGSKVQYEEVDFEKSTRGLYDKPMVKLIDFGLAEKITGSFSFAIKGTLNYLAPEILGGMTPDKRADLYSLGVTIYQVVNRDLPFYQDVQAFSGPAGFDSRSELFEANMKKHPDYLRDLILRLIEESPDDRFQSAKEVIQFVNKNSDFAFEVETEETRASYFHSPRLVGRKKEMNLLKRHYELLFFPHRVRSRSDDPGGDAPLPSASSEAEADDGVECGTAEVETDDPAQVLVVTGEMGSGKSRLLEEFQHFLKLNDTNVYRGNCYEGKQKAYQPLVEVLRQLVYSVGPKSELVRRYEEQVRKLLPGLSERKASGSVFDTSRPEKDKQCFIDRISQLMVDVAEEVPYVLVINNLHWVDEASVDLIEKLIGRVEEARRQERPLKLLLILSQRSEEQRSDRVRELVADLKEQRFALEIPVRRLRRAQISEVLQAMLRISDVPEGLSEKLEEQTGGNPLFLVETLKALEDEGIIKHGVDGWVVKATKYSRVEIPHSMEELLLKRLDGYTREKRLILRTMAVLDKPVSPKFLQKFERLQRCTILVELRDLESAGLVQKLFDNGKLHFAIQQPKVREILYTHMEDDERRRIHGEVGAAFEEAYRHREEEILEELAYHYQRSDRQERAMRLALRAGDRLKEIYANERAHEYYMYVLEEVADAPEYLDVYFDTREKLGDICTTMGRYDEADDHYNALLVEDFREMLDPERVIRIYVRRGKVREIQGDYDMALHSYKDARNYLSTRCQGEQTVERARVYNSIGWIYVCMGKYEKAMTISLEALRVIQDLPEAIEHAMVYGTIGSANYYKGNIREAIKYHRKALQIKENLEDIPEIIVSLNNLGEAYLAEAEYGDAVDLLRRALATSEEIGDPYGRAMTLHRLALLHVSIGDLDEASRCLEESILQSKAYNMRYLNLQNYVVRGMVLYERKEFSKAEGNFFRVLTAYSKQGNRAGLCSILLKMAAVHRQNFQLEEARSTVDEATRYAEALGIQTLQARASLEAARLCRLYPEPEYAQGLRLLEQALAVAGRVENPELLGEIHFETAETLVCSREVQQATAHYKAAEERFREVLESLPREFRSTYESWQRSRFPNWSAESRVIPTPRPESPSIRPATAPPEGSEAATPEEALRVVGDLMRALPTASSRDAFLGDLLDGVLAVTGAEIAYILSLCGRSLSVVYARSQLGTGEEPRPGTLLCLQLIDDVLKRQSPTYIDQLWKDPEAAAHLEESSVDCRTLAVFPFLEPDGKKGALYLINSALPGPDGATSLPVVQPFLNLIPVSYLQFATPSPTT